MNLELELRKKYYDVHYLDGIDEKINSPVSVVIPTYNRSPFDPTTEMGKYNPLQNALLSLLDQKNVNIKEIIVVNDGSEDYTKEVVKSLSKESNIEIVHLENEKRLGKSNSRNVGIAYTSEKLVFICDDDCIYSPWSIFGAQYSFLKTSQRNDIAVLKIPVYQRRTSPPSVKRIDQIGYLDLERGIKTDSYDSFPIEYLNGTEEKFLDSKNRILKPFEIFDLDQAYVIDKKAWEDVGGFTQLPWEGAIGEHMEFACKLREKNYRMFLTPDPKFQAVHIRFGQTGNGFEGDDWYKNNGVSLKDLIAISNEFSRKIKTRAEGREWYKNIIASRFMLFSKRSLLGAKRYLANTYREFVKENRMFTYYPIDNEKEREETFVSAVDHAQKILYKFGTDF